MKSLQASLKQQRPMRASAAASAAAGLPLSAFPTQPVLAPPEADIQVWGKRALSEGGRVHQPSSIMATPSMLPSGQLERFLHELEATRLHAGWDRY